MRSSLRERAVQRGRRLEDAEAGEDSSGGGAISAAPGLIAGLRLDLNFVPPNEMAMAAQATPSQDRTSSGQAVLAPVRRPLVFKDTPPQSPSAFTPASSSSSSSSSSSTSGAASATGAIGSSPSSSTTAAQAAPLGFVETEGVKVGIKDKLEDIALGVSDAPLGVLGVDYCLLDKPEGNKEDGDRLSDLEDMLGPT